VCAGEEGFFAALGGGLGDDDEAVRGVDVLRMEVEWGQRRRKTKESVLLSGGRKEGKKERNDDVRSALRDQHLRNKAANRTATDYQRRLTLLESAPPHCMNRHGERFRHSTLFEGDVRGEFVEVGFGGGEVLAEATAETGETDKAEFGASCEGGMGQRKEEKRDGGRVTI
jgi:hypothetical protein